MPLGHKMWLLFMGDFSSSKRMKQHEGSIAAHSVLQMSCSVARGHVGLCGVQSLLR